MKLTKGVALVLTGKEGCGKSSVARRIAAENGSYIEVGMAKLKGFGLGKVLNQLPKTVIVESFTQPTKDELDKIKAWIANDSIAIDLKGQPQKTVPLPNFIFCSGLVDPFNVGVHDRRFQVFHLDNDNNEVIHEKSPSEFKEWVDKKIAMLAADGAIE